MGWTGAGENAEQVPPVKGGLWGQEDAGLPQPEVYPVGFRPWTHCRNSALPSPQGRLDSLSW